MPDVLLHRDTGDAARFWFVEHWTGRAALDAHMKTAHFRTLGAALEGRLARPLSVDVLEPLS